MALDEKRIERAARAICLAKGIDPDLRTPVGWEIVPGRPKTRAFGPAWMNERDSATAVLAVLDEERK